MKSFRSDRKFSRIALAAMLGVVVTVGCVNFSTPVLAADDDDEELLDTQIVQGVLKALGLRKDEGKQGITYRERSPLVLPANKSLPAPETSNPATKTAGWPDDPDVKQEKKRKEAKRNRKAYVEGVDDRPLLPSQYGANGNVSPGTSGTSSNTIDETSRPSSLKDLGTKSIFSGNLFAPKNETATFTGEPRREALTDPPAGYRTPSPNQPYGLGPDTTRPTALNPSAVHDDVSGK
jgi:hypothetical protein